MNRLHRLLPAIACLGLLVLAVAPASQALDQGCGECHAKLLDKPVVHAAAQRRCTACHDDAKQGVRHDGPGNPPLRRLDDSPDRCMSCHEAEEFTGKFTHAPVAEGKCLGCHDPHASEQKGLLKTAPAALCLDCHPNVKKGPHVVAGFSQRGHPLGDGDTQAEDPLRPGNPFYCAGCHEPHRSEWRTLLRWDPTKMSCQVCHQK
jgi:predicted CXXCH cytochrome family protein